MGCCIILIFVHHLKCLFFYKGHLLLASCPVTSVDANQTSHCGTAAPRAGVSTGPAVHASQLGEGQSLLALVPVSTGSVCCPLHTLLLRLLQRGHSSLPIQAATIRFFFCSFFCSFGFFSFFFLKESTDRELPPCL